MSRKKQVNIQLPEKLAWRVKADAAGLGVMLNAYSEQAYERFLALPVAVRRSALSDKSHKKLVGRKLKLEEEP